MIVYYPLNKEVKCLVLYYIGWNWKLYSHLVSSYNTKIIEWLIQVEPCLLLICWLFDKIKVYCRPIKSLGVSRRLTFKNQGKWPCLKVEWLFLESLVWPYSFRIVQWHIKCWRLLPGWNPELSHEQDILVMSHKPDRLALFPHICHI